MFIILVENEEDKGAFSVINEFDEKVLLFFEEEDDAERYLMMLDDMGINGLSVVEYDEDLLMKTCKVTGLKYSKISPYDFVVPPGYCSDD